MAGDFYTVLGVPREATAEQVRRAYRELAKRLHPDVNGAADAAAAFSKVQRAYATLSDETRRRAYDRRRAARAAPAPEPGDAPREATYTWANVAARPSPARPAGDPTGFDELWEALFEPRLRARGHRGTGRA